ncbi:HIT family protein [Streptomyces sp. NPDC101132]|uniref:HIT family protein n=1 Tax=Streptomyces sp. NPDC101132 TaxID=3366110 RepID=UPI00380D404E
MTVEPSEFVKRLPLGERIPMPEGGIPFWEVFPYEGDLRIKVLDEPVLPEPPREGEEDRPCKVCPSADGAYDGILWSDEHWWVRGFADPEGLPAMVMLLPRAHFDLSDMPPERAAELGPLLQRVEGAVLAADGVARVHVNRYGDGAEHLHWWFFARPAGMLQLRGTCLPLWGDVLPKVPLEEWRETHRRIARALAAGGGAAHV